MGHKISALRAGPGDDPFSEAPGATQTIGLCGTT